MLCPHTAILMPCLSTAITALWGRYYWVEKHWIILSRCPERPQTQALPSYKGFHMYSMCAMGLLVPSLRTESTGSDNVHVTFSGTNEICTVSSRTSKCKTSSYCTMLHNILCIL